MKSKERYGHTVFSIISLFASMWLMSYGPTTLVKAVGVMLLFYGSFALPLHFKKYLQME